MPQVRRQHRISSEAADTVKINSQLRRNFQWNADINKYLACSSIGALELGQNHARRTAAIDLFNRFKSKHKKKDKKNYLCKNVSINQS